MNDATIKNCNMPARMLKAIFQSVLENVAVSPSLLAAAHAYLESYQMIAVKRDICKPNDAEQIIKDDRGIYFLTCIVDSHLAHIHSIATIATIASNHSSKSNHTYGP